MDRRKDDEKDSAMSDQPGLVEALQSIFGGAFTSFAGAMAGRLMFHGNEVRAKRRRIIGWELVWELPTAFGMGLVGEGAAQYFGWEASSRTAAIVVLSYLGPRGAQAAFDRWITKGGKE